MNYKKIKITWYGVIPYILGMVVGLCVLVIFKCVEKLWDGMYYILER